MFKNMMMYRIQPNWNVEAADMEAGLDRARFEECGASQEKSIGWVEPRGEKHGPLVEIVAGQRICKLMVEIKTVPSSVIARKAQERSAQIEVLEGRKPGKKELRDIKEGLKISLLPMAFTKQSSVWVWIDPSAHLLVIDAPSQARADEVISLLVKCLDGFAVTLINTKISPALAMAQWLITQEPPPDFSVDRECELKAQDETKAVVRYTRHALDTDEVRLHIEGGKSPTRVALTWNDRVSFVLTDTFQIKKLAFLDIVFESASSGKKEEFDTNVAITTAELQKLVPDLLLALDGEAVMA